MNTNRCTSMLFVFTLAMLLAGGQSSAGQQARSPSASAGSAGAEPVASQGASLPADQIIELLHARPELVIELKKVAAQKLQEQGVDVQEDSITDEMLYGRIASDSQLRNSLTLWLRARGYVSGIERQPAEQSQLDWDEDSKDRYTSPAQLLASLPPDAYDRAALNQDQEADLAALQSQSQSYATQTPMRTSLRQSRNPTQQPNQEVPNAAEPKTLRQPTPFNLLSLRDLYTQVPDQSSSLK